MRPLTLPVVAPAQTQAPAAAQSLPAWQRGLHHFGTGALLGAVVSGGLTGIDAAIGLTVVGDVLVVAALGFLIVFAGEGLALLLRALVVALLRVAKVTGLTRTSGAALAVALGRVAGAGVLLYGHVLFPNSFLKYVTLLPISQVVLPAVALGWVLVALARTAGLAARPRYALLGAAALLAVGTLAWLLYPGYSGYLAHAPLAAAQPVAALPFTDPGLPGDFAVQTLTYGSGLDRWQPAYGADAALTTAPVDGSNIFPGFGLADGYLRWRRGFDMTQMPLNGRVWYPAGAGPFPLVLIVHGAHNAFEDSELGYAYLAEHLASRGYIAVAVDENFLNGTALGDGEGREVAARAWLLLKHLQGWRDWNATAGNPFFGRVDLDNIALIGHSRGGEAVAAATVLNTRTQGAIISRDFDFNIRAVVALAPSDWFYQPNGQLLKLKDTSYLVLGGSHDADTYTFYGLAQYHRTQLTAGSDQFKALVYLNQANHGQFNTVWGDHDRGRVGSLALNRAPLMSGEAQRQAAKVFIAGFLEATLRGRAEYRALFYRPAAAQAWLPDSLLVTAYQDASFVPLATFDTVRRRDITEAIGGAATTEGLTTWAIAPLKLRDGQRDQDNIALHLAWEAGAAARYQIDLPKGAAADWQLGPADALTFALMPVSADPLSLSLELTDAAGVTVRLPLSQFGAIPPPLPAELVKADWLLGPAGFNITLAQRAELVPQVYDLPLAAFAAADPLFQPGQLSRVRFVFDGAAGGDLYLDEIGLRRAP